ncbi:FtsX-like permease family protein [Dokdonia sinensis]|uniref:FtsX-like permease family protein n=1 Tax=Dokdonia sinensis TaxID=2479847 RepID=A0A3M0FX93_9FLAO|nr:ABC transporter permease [Dokdonia sinensis]RMB57125.1 FtsX-like permease family protein [Dokdonia sinensis]
MIKNYIKIAFRNLKRQPLFTGINVLGLAVGMVGSLLIALFIIDELSYNKMFTDVDQIYRIDTDVKFGGAEIQTAEASAPMAGAMQRDFPEVEQTVRFRDRGELLIRSTETQENTKGSDATFVDPSFFEFFDIQLLSGNSATALNDANTLVLSETVAQRVFNTTDVVGKTVLLSNKNTYKVTGVLKDLPKNSFLKDHGIFMAMDGYPDSKGDLWGSMNYYTYVKLQPGTNIQAFDKKVAGMLETYMLPWAKKIFPGMTPEAFEASGDYIEYHTIPLKDIYLHSDREAEMSETGSIQNVYILGVVGLFLVFLACVNFMNLSTAQSLRRAREIGIRKTLGSSKGTLIWQFISESQLVALVAMVIAIAVSFLVLPHFNELAQKDISVPLANPLFWVVILAVTLLLGFVSGSYPAFFMSRFNPVDTLKGEIKGNVGGGAIRSGLVIFQFTVAVVLIVGTLVVFKQLQFIQNKDLGFEKEQVLLIDNVFSAGNQLDAFKAEVEKIGAVESATISSQMPTPSDRSNSTYFLEGKTNQGDAIQIQEWSVDYDYLNTIGLELVAGRDFDRSITTDAEGVIINEASLDIIGLDAQEALGSRIIELDSGNEPVKYTIVGVVKNFHYEPLREKIGALALFLDKSSGMMAVKMQSEDYASTIALIENLWKQQAPGQPFDYSFMDEDFEETYSQDRRISTILLIFTGLSIFIACLGLFGLATFNAQRRFKEIGVRKVLGASVSQITVGLTLDFLKLVSIATLIALPLGWYAMHTWLQDFSYRTTIGWEVLVGAVVLVAFIAIITVSYQSIKAATANPVKSLKTE